MACHLVAVEDSVVAAISALEIGTAASIVVLLSLLYAFVCVFCVVRCVCIVLRCVLFYFGVGTRTQAADKAFSYACEKPTRTRE